MAKQVILNTQMTKEFYIWEGIYNSFQEAAPFAHGPGFNGDVYRTRALNVAHECLTALNTNKQMPFLHKQRSTLLPAVVAMMRGRKGKIKIVDFGGGLGIGYMTLAESIPNHSDFIHYEIVEVPQICEVGRELFNGRDVTYSDILPLHGEFDLVHSASAIQYIEDWPQVLKILCGYEAKYLLLSDVFAGSVPSFVTLQNYYGSKICHWFLNLDELILTISRLGFKMVMKNSVFAHRLGVENTLPMENFPRSHRLENTWHLLFSRKS